MLHHLLVKFKDKTKNLICLNWKPPFGARTPRVITHPAHYRPHASKASAVLRVSIFSAV